MYSFGFPVVRAKRDPAIRPFSALGKQLREDTRGMKITLAKTRSRSPETDNP